MKVLSGTGTGTGSDGSPDGVEGGTGISYTAATKQPRLKKRPPLDIPQQIIDDEIEGVVKIVIDINEKGKVVAARVTKSLHPLADKACVKSWKKAVFRPAKQLFVCLSSRPPRDHTAEFAGGQASLSA